MKSDDEDFSSIDQKEAETVRQDVERFLQTCEQVLEARFSNSKGSTNGDTYGHIAQIIGPSAEALK